ncbi:hypothetical protein EYF80_011942 [Liparis tanakae]|uniref:Uncharacterized protein n=1 Tax=Liparis tanakae TaxID=230148 RepID=A0A4Z2IJB8_9TELE|nr:hypothetical protein EYF80_011942 [Liparis tanakae]
MFTAAPQLGSLEALRCWMSFHYSRPPGDRQRYATRVLLSGNAVPASGDEPISARGGAKAVVKYIAELNTHTQDVQGHGSFCSLFVGEQSVCCGKHIPMHSREVNPLRKKPMEVIGLAELEWLQSSSALCSAAHNSFSATPRRDTSSSPRHTNLSVAEQAEEPYTSCSHPSTPRCACWSLWALGAGMLGTETLGAGMLGHLIFGRCELRLGFGGVKGGRTLCRVTEHHSTKSPRTKK